MKNIKYLTGAGLLMLLSSILLLTYAHISTDVGRVMFSALVLFAGISAYLFAQANRKNNKAFIYHFIQAAGLVGYGIVSFVFYKEPSSLLIGTMIILGTIGLIEFMFAIGVVQDKEVDNKRILYTRLLSGAINTIASFVLLWLFLENVELGIILSGACLALGGVSFMILAQKIKA